MGFSQERILEWVSISSSRRSSQSRVKHGFPALQADSLPLSHQKVKVLIAQLCPTLFDPVDCSPPGFSVHGKSQARILEWVAISSSRGSSQPRDRTRVSTLQADALSSEPPGKSWFADNMMLYTEIPIDSTKKLLELMNEFSKVADTKLIHKNYYVSN